MKLLLRLWEELTPEQQQEFIKQMDHAGWRNRTEDANHVYQIKDGTCHGWIEGWRQKELTRRDRISSIPKLR